MKYGEWSDAFISGKNPKKVELGEHGYVWLVEYYVGHARITSRGFKNFRSAKKLAHKIAKKHGAPLFFS